jgi:hypothetical protein
MITPEQVERFLQAIEKIADALDTLANGDGGAIAEELQAIGHVIGALDDTVQRHG